VVPCGALDPVSLSAHDGEIVVMEVGRRDAGAANGPPVG
jgi:hypothetical protein